METETYRVIDKRGAVLREGAQVPNLDRGFWLPFGVGNPGISLSQVMSRPYQHHGWSYACGRAIAFNVSRLKHIYAVGANDAHNAEQPLPYDDDLVALFRRPNPLMTEMQFWQAILLNLLFPIETSNLTARDGAVLHGGMNQTGGTCFIIPWMGNEDRPADLSKGEIPTELLPMGARFFHPILSQNKRGLSTVEGWSYKIPEQHGVSIDFAHNQIIRIYLFNPYVWISGMSPFFAVQTAVDQDARADIYNTRFFENDATPGGILSTKENLTPGQARDIRREFMQTYGGIGNARKLAVLWGGLEYSKMALDHAEMQFSQQKDANLEQLLAVFGLNKIAVGKYEQLNFATIKEGRKCLWHDTYMPLDEIIWDAINNQWFTHIRNGVRGYSDYSKVPALQEEIKPKAETAALLVRDLQFSPALACEKAGIQLSHEELALYPYLQEKPERLPQPLLGGLPGAYQTDEKLDETKAKLRNIKDLTQEQRDKRTASYVKGVLDNGERNFLLILNRYFFSQRNRILDKVDAWLVKQSTKAITKTDYIDPRVFMLDIDSEFDKMLKIYHPAVEHQLRLEQKELENELGSMIAWEVTDKYIDNAVKQRADLLSQINNSTFQADYDGINAAIREGTEANLTPNEMAKLIKENVGAVYDVRTGQIARPHGEFDLGGMSSSTTIARTEMGTISSMARYDAYKAEGVDEIEWSTAEDDLVRETHVEVNGMRIKLGDVFGITGLRYPRDPFGDPGEIINCVLPETKVSGSFVGGLKAVYSGNAIELITKSGNRLCVTVNHPIATLSGFIPANRLHKGDSVVCHCGDTYLGRSISNNDIKNGEASVENVYNAISAHGAMRVHSPSAFDLDGDGEFLRSNIEAVVGLRALSGFPTIRYPELIGKEKSSHLQFDSEFFFPSADKPNESIDFSCGYSLAGDSAVINSSSACIPHAATLPNERVGVISDVYPFEIFRFGLASELNISRYQYSTYRLSGYSKFISDLIFTFPREIFIDDIVSVKMFEYSGHVYDLQSSVGYFNSNNIISRNCRCTTFSYLGD